MMGEQKGLASISLYTISYMVKDRQRVNPRNNREMRRKAEKEHKGKT